MHPLPTQIVIPPPPVPPAPYLPFPQLGSAPLDEANNGWGIAQTTARSRHLQARIQWIDATANLDRINSPEKVKAVVAQIKGAGFNSICLDVKPIGGEVLYNSRVAPKITSFSKSGQLIKTLPADFDPLAAMATECRAQGINLLANFNAFSEGHQLFGTGPGYAHPEWQTVLYEEKPSLLIPTAPAPLPLAVRVNELPLVEAEIAVYTDTTRITADLAYSKKPQSLVVVLDKTGSVVAQTTGAFWRSPGITLPEGGAALVALSPASTDALKRFASVGVRVTLASTPNFVPIGQRPRRQVPLMTNPFRPDVRDRLLAIISEVVTGYDISGVIFDDRLRYAGLDADFSPEARQGFETYVGRTVRWPDDILRYAYRFPTLERTMTPGPDYDAWLVFRALTLRNFLAGVVRTVKTAKPNVTVSTYVGSWYPDYPDVGANWAGDDFGAGFRFLSPSYEKTGWAGLTDFVVTGCYYTTATIADAVANGEEIGSTVEAAGQFSNRAVNDNSWTYAGIALSDFKNKTPDDLKRALQAACATTQGVMVFDFSHDWEQWQPVFAEAFKTPATPPHLVPDALAEVRRQHAAKKAAGIIDPPTILYKGKSGTGF